MDNDCPTLFAYGTLRDRSVNHKAHFLHKHGVYIGKGFIYARLYKVTWYPAVILDEERRDKVFGDIYELPLAGREMVLHELDGYEGIYSTNEESEEYERVLTEATLEDGRKMQVWVYNYKVDLPEENRIVSGDYIDFLKTAK